MNKKRINIIFIILIYLFIYLIFKENASLSNITFLSFKMYILKVFPFLFIMMILNNLLLKCNFPYYFNKIFKSDKLYIFINSILSGSPINAILIKNYLDNNCINEDNASKLLCFTSFNNPLFLYNYLMLILNNINNVDFIAGDTEVVLDDLINNKKIIPDVVMVDPPRKGLDNRSIDNILKIKPDRVVYISCNPATLVRDLAKFEEDYVIEEIRPVDMFPFTKHVECVAVLQFSF